MTDEVRDSLSDEERGQVVTGGAISGFSSPLSTVGKSGIKHKFTFGTSGKEGTEVVCDVVVSSSPVDETKVLSLFIKVYDVGAKQAVLCAVPSLSSEARKLANQYKILVVESKDDSRIGDAMSGVFERLAKERGSGV